MYDVAILGATGAVGLELVSVLESRDFPIRSLRLLASARSAGTSLTFKEETVAVQEVGPSSFEGVDFAFFSAGSARSKEWAPVALESGATVIDNSSAFRMEPRVPLVVPEINSHVLSAGSSLVSVPNCSAIILLMAVASLRKLGKIERLVVSTYQSASGGGASLMRRLVDETRLALEAIESGLSIPAESSGAEPYAFNLFSHNSPVGSSGYNEEELKVVEESRKILEVPDLRINVTCVRVPVLRAHSEAVTVEFDSLSPGGDGPREGEALECAARRVLSQAPGVRVVDERERNRFPTPLRASGGDDVLVGRIRKDLSHPSAISMFVCGDQLRKGAALNAVQIAENLMGLRSEPATTIATPS